MAKQKNQKPPEALWAIVELLGHRKIAGRVTEQTIAGASLVRIDVPDVPGDDYNDPIAGFTQFYGASSLYCLSPVTEDVANRYAQAIRSAPIQRFELPAIRRPADPIAVTWPNGGAAAREEDEDQPPI
jgi:hypothetical protein